MLIRRIVVCCGVLFLSAGSLAAASDLADAVMRQDKATVQALLERGTDVDAPQADGATALHWAARWDDLETTELLLRAGADASAANIDGATPLLLAAMNGNAAIIDRLIQAGADPNAPVGVRGDTPLMIAARTGRIEAVRTLLDHGADVNARETGGGTMPLMWAIAEGHIDIVRVLLSAGAEIDARSYFVPSATGRGFEGATAKPPEPDQKVAERASGWMTPLMFASREGNLEMARLLIESGADANVLAGDGKNALALAIFNGHYALASYLVDQGIDVNQADAERFTPLFWAIDRRNMELAANGLPWMIKEDPLPLIKKLLDAGADPNAVIQNIPRARNRGGTPRIVIATPLMRAAFSGDLEVSKLLLAYGGDPFVKSRDRESMLQAACGHALIPGYQMERPEAERFELVKVFVDLGEDVNWADSYGITPLMSCANLGYSDIVQYLVDVGADLGAYDLGKRLDGAFMASIEPLMPLDYAIGVGTFLPNNSVVPRPETAALMRRLMAERGIVHTTSECTLRGFTCSTASVDPKTATPAEIARARRVQTGEEVDGLATGLNADEELKVLAPADPTPFTPQPLNNQQNQNNQQNR